jgi:hypothetical protein
MKEFGISEDDAARMFFEDWEYIPAGSKVRIERVKDLQTKKEYAKAEKPRNAKPRERKVDATKGRILKDCKVLVEGLGATDTALKTETELSFTFEGSEYTLKLTKHRPKK